jgi:hypothetical protein
LTGAEKAADAAVPKGHDPESDPNGSRKPPRSSPPPKAMCGPTPRSLKAHWRKISSTNPLERMNKEIKRRSNVVGIVPDDASVIRLVGAVLLEQHEGAVSERRYLSEESMAHIAEGGQHHQQPRTPSCLRSNQKTKGHRATSTARRDAMVITRVAREVGRAHRPRTCVIWARRANCRTTLRSSTIRATPTGARVGQRRSTPPRYHR